MVENKCGNLDAGRRLEAFKKIVPHLRGALWWAANGIITERQPDFNQADAHLGHPVEKNWHEVGRHDEKACLWNAPRFKYRKLRPNWDKPIANESEVAMIDDYCIIHML